MDAIWERVYRDLVEICSQQLFPSIGQDQAYQRIVSNAGITDSLNRPMSSRSDQQKRRIREAMEYFLELCILDLIGSDGIDAQTAQATVIQQEDGSHRFYYRLWDSNSRRGALGSWWFDEDLVSLCVGKAKQSDEKRREQFRKALAVSRNWSALDRMSRFEVFGAIRVPAIVGSGEAKRYYSPGALAEAAAQGRTIDKKHYWQHYSKMLPGGEKQYYLPFLPLSLIKPVRYVVNS